MRLSMHTWELYVSNRLRDLRLGSIRSKILTFALLATLIPSISTAWISYLQNKRSLTGKITEELRSLSSQTAREMDLWVRAHVYDLKVFAASYEVSENLDRLPRARLPALNRLNNYLNSVAERFVDFEELLVLDPQGRIVATTGASSGVLRLPADWQTEIRGDDPVLGEVAWDSAAKKPVIPFAVPIRLGSGRLVGVLTARLNLATVGEILVASRSETGDAYLLTDNAQLILRSRGSSADLMQRELPPATVASLRRAAAQGDGAAIEYVGLDGEEVVGTMRVIPRLNWSVVVEIPTVEAYRQVARLRNWTILIVTGLLLVVGSLGYFLSLLIVRPLDRLTQGAAKVAAGDLDVDIPVVSAGEVGYLTEVFNDMVRRLREGREKLERLSITDSLTGLFNRRHLMDRLDAEADRAERHTHVFSVMMVDVDHFKRYNDANGHLAGDEVLKKLAAVLTESIREVDTAARYGGEEFVVILPETANGGAAEVAERIRAKMAAAQFTGGEVTLSIGVAEFPAHGNTPESVIASADAALYDAKSAGRDRVERATRKRSSKPSKREA